MNSLPYRFVVVVTATIFVAEVVVMFFLSLVPPLPVWATSLVDALLLAVLMLPVLYLVLFRPLQQYIDERQQVESALRESELRFRSVAQVAHDAIITANSTGTIIFWNDAAQKIFGYSPDEILGQPLSRLMPARYHQQHEAALSHVQATGKPRQVAQSINLFAQRKDGSEFPIEISLATWKTQAGTFVSASIHDLSHRIQTEAVLRKMQFCMDQAADSIFWIGPDARFFYVNEAACRHLGYSRQEMLRLSVPDIDPAFPLTQWPETWSQLRQQGSLRLESHHQTKSGTLVPVEISANYANFDGQEFDFVFVRDISERLQDQARLVQQATLLDIATDAVLVRDLEHRILYWNKAAERIYGWRAAEVLNQRASELFYRDQTHFQAAHQAVLAHGEWSGELHQVTRTRQEIIVLSRWTLVRDHQGQAQSIFVISTDITEKKKLEAQLLRTQRLESIGQLASGIAHDLNNILAPILMLGPLLREQVHNPQVAPLLDTLERSAKRGAEVVRQILTFSRGIKSAKGPVQTLYVLKEVTSIIRETFPRSIKLQTNLAQDLWPVTGDTTQLHQVLMNLCVNARDAMPEGGTLMVGAENVQLDSHFTSTIPNAKPGPHIVWLVADTGIGIPPEHMERIFDPFFTTKEVGKGTGLGLSTVLGIVRNHDGIVRVESQVGHGTQFRVYLPTCGEPLPQSGTEGVKAPPGGSEVVLVVDDEEPIRLLAKSVLEQRGYQVLLASEGVEALDLYAQHQGQIQLVLSDIMMPQMDGVMLFRTLKRLAPKLKTIAATGMATSPALTQIRQLGVQALLRKPFFSEQLLSTVRAVLDDTPLPAACAWPDKEETA